MSYTDREQHGRLHGVSSHEVSLVGAVLLDPHVLDRCDDVRAEDFADARLRKVWTLAHRLHADGTAPDLVTLANAYEATGEAPDIDFFMALAEAKATTVNIRHHAELVRLDADRRRAIQACLGAIATLEQASLYEPGDVVRALNDAALSVDVACSRDAGGEQAAARLDAALHAFLGGVKQRYEAWKANRPILTAMTTGFDALDEMIGGGLMLGGIYGLGAAEKAGKTALAMQWVEAAALSGRSVMVFSYEVPNDHSAGRILSARSGVRNSAMLSGCLRSDDPALLVHAVNVVQPWAQRVHLRFAPGTPVEYVEQEVRRFTRSTAHREAPLGLVVVDHLHCLTASPGAPRMQSDDAHLRNVVQRLANLGSTTGAAVLALSQHNRDRRTRAADSPPRPTDIRGSAALVEKVWALMQIHRPGVDPGNDMDPAEAAVYVTANRYGGTGFVKLRFDGPRQRFDLPRGWSGDR